MSKTIKYEIPNADNCRDCKYGSCYNNEWCECHHPLVNPSKVQIKCGCIVKMWIGGNEK